MERWLSLTILKTPSEAPLVHISIPKRTVKLAVARNRLKRVLREAVRQDPFFEGNRTYRLVVRRVPATVDLKSAQRTLEALHD
jgi:ribonuclease P protein component